MYYIVNHTDHIIAADHSLLDSLSLSNIDELYYRISIGDIAFRTTDECQLYITTPKGGRCYKVEKVKLAGIIGDLTIIRIEQRVSHEDHSYTEPETATPADTETIDLNMDESELFTLLEDEPEKEERFMPENEPDPITLFDDEEKITLLEDAEEDSTEQESREPKDAEQRDESPIRIDVEKISQKIGISTEDYNIFLDEYIDTALNLEADLNSQELQKRAHALSTLKHLSNVLHLPVVSDILEEIKSTEESHNEEAIKSFYAVLARLTTAEEKSENSAPFTLEEEVEETPVTVHSKGFGHISLDDVKPKHFDFQIEKAAEELELPVSLIEEFVHDFIEQAKVETQHMLQAYEEGDLEKIQKLGHLLKGTSSNLRITPLADLLYKIQICEDSDQLEALIKEYWAHFLAFEKQIKLISK